jgi:restriction system protein
MTVPTGQMLVGSLEKFHTARGLVRYRIELEHPGLHKHQVITGEHASMVANKAHLKLLEWNEQWEKKQAALAKKKKAASQKAAIEEKKASATTQTIEAQAELEALEGILAATLQVDDTIDWNELKSVEAFPEPKPAKPRYPAPPEPLTLPDRPTAKSRSFKSSMSILDKLVPARRRTRLEEAQAEWDGKRRAADEELALQILEHKQSIEALDRKYEADLSAWNQRREEYLSAQVADNALVDLLRDKYREGDPSAVEEYCSLVIEHSIYPDYFPKAFELEYTPENGMLVIDYELPDINDMPTLREVKYVQSRNGFDEKQIPDSQRRSLYDGLIYQVALRTVHEVYEADQIDALQSVVFNGIVESTDRGTGQRTRACILSLQAGRDEFLAIKLAAVDPKACFKKLKGVAASKLHSLTPVAPIVMLERDDVRFIEGYSVGEHIREGDNLAMMDWEDFEHLIRELFEKEFGQAGAEVKVTRASRDAGVDAVILDPDPLRGGKIVIQAKRYANTVGVSAVRDLYGTLMNEGAIKGILVTTSNYGPDAYEFAKGKPLTLLDGANLLHLLERHGHKARIDLKEAKQALRDGR